MHKTFSPSNKLKVLRLSHSGGVSAYRERERQLIARHPVEVKLFIPKHWEHLGSDNGSVNEDFDLLRIGTYGTGSIPLFLYEPSPIIDQLKAFKPDVVDIHEEPYSVSCFEVVSLVNKILPTAAIVFYSAQNILKRYPPPFCWTEQYVYRSCAGAYPCSGGVKEVLNAKGFSTNDGVIPLGVDTERFSPKKMDRAQHNIPPDSTVVGYFGRFEECKGINYMFEALASLTTISNWHVVMVGTGEYQSVLKEQASKLQISNRISWIGEVNASDVPLFINLCDLMVVPSVTTATWKEQFGRAVTESMACGVPVVSSDSGSLPEVVGDAGLVVPERDSTALAAAFARVFSEPDLLNELKSKSLERARSLYTWEKVADMTFDFYLRALKVKSDRQSTPLG